MEKRETAFNKSGNYSEEDLRREIADPEAVPEYMRTIIEAHKSDMPIYYNITWEDQLNWLFYEYTAAMENHSLVDRVVSRFRAHSELLIATTTRKARKASSPLESKARQKAEGFE